MAWFLYLIKANDNTLYTGITTDVARRFHEHNSQSKKASKYLRGRTPLKLIGCVEVDSRSEATKLEIEIKKMSPKGKLTLFNYENPKAKQNANPKP
ncbi:MAG: GIY-YIG nuclease family protein [Francisellaceae bacterium]|jgi:putative endonuclease|nr:GIY-YIG nuclease family protein [Francisellaceae bacterium]MBT6207184.1 GIY-YIG nuclease family protein [Francisellaceae bacterium]MBT6537863.1 GIY-YIG nuclease family protein [Francisellaceae bacterium]